MSFRRDDSNQLVERGASDRDSFMPIVEPRGVVQGDDDPSPLGGCAAA